MIDLGTLMGALGLAAGIASLLYTRLQVRAERIQAAETIRVSILERNTEMIERSMEIRRRFLGIPTVQQEFLKNVIKQQPLSEIVGLVTGADGIDRYLAYRDAMDLGQDAYFLRRAGIMPDEYWQVWSKVHMKIWSRFPAFETTFRSCASAGWLHPDFARFFESYFRNTGVTDPQGTGAKLPRV